MLLRSTLFAILVALPAFAAEPKLDADAALPGEADIRVTLNKDGSVRAAELVRETPEGHGFGEAALGAIRARNFGAGEDGHVATFRMRFRPKGQNEPTGPQPAYPQRALTEKVSGDVELWVQANTDGSVRTAELVREQPEGYGFGEAALAAARQWNFGAGEENRIFPAFRLKFRPTSATTAADLPDLLRGPAPAYPGTASDRKVEGYADLLVQLNADGTVEKVEVLREVPQRYGFGAAARTAMRRWVFVPGPEGRSFLYRMDFRMR